MSKDQRPAPSVSDKPLMRDAAVGLTADELEATGKAPWHGKQPIEDFAKDWKGRPWVPLEAAIAELQFWQRRDYEHGLAIPLTTPTPVEEPLLVDLLTKAVGDITAALIMAGKEASVEAWTAPYVEAINRADDATPVEEPAKGAVDRIKYEGEAVEAVQRLLERGKAYIDKEGYLSLIASGSDVEVILDTVLPATPSPANAVASVSDEQVEVREAIAAEIQIGDRYATADRILEALRLVQEARLEPNETHPGSFSLMKLNAAWPTISAALQAQPNGGAKVEDVVQALYKRLRDGDDAKDGWTDYGMEAAFFRWAVIERELTAALSTKP